MIDTERNGFWRDRATLVTGATGLLGAALVQALLRHQARVVCLVRDWVPESELFRTGDANRASIVRGDLTDRDCLERVLGEFEIAGVFHLAAQPIVGIANRNPLSTFETNIAGTWRLLEACRRSPAIKHIVIASSDKAYGSQEALPFHEEMALKGRHPYDVSKACSDLIAQTYAATFSAPLVITRCGNFYGGGDLNFNRIIPGTIRSALRGEQPVIRSDGSYVRDYLYVEDAVSTYLMLAEKLTVCPELAGQAFNFSDESRTSVLELVRLVLNIVGTDLQPRVLNEVKNEVRNEYLSCSKARAALGWSPKFTLAEGLTRTIAWYRDYLGGNASSRFTQDARRQGALSPAATGALAGE